MSTIQYSADKTADALIYTGKCNFYGIVVVNDGTNHVTISVYDGLTAAGTKIIPTFVQAVADGTIQSFGFNIPIECQTGIFVDITTVGTATFKVYYNTINL